MCIEANRRVMKVKVIRKVARKKCCLIEQESVEYIAWANAGPSRSAPRRPPFKCQARDARTSDAAKAGRISHLVYGVNKREI